MIKNLPIYKKFHLVLVVVLLVGTVGSYFFSFQNDQSLNEIDNPVTRDDLGISFGNSGKYLDQDGEYRQIETEIVEVEDQRSEFEYENTRNNFESRFNSDIDGTIAEFAVGDSNIEFGIGANENLGERNEVEPRVEESSITYQDIYSDVDLKYTVSENQLKEEYIIYSRDVAAQLDELVTPFSYEGTRYEENGDGSISFFDLKSDELLWTVNRPSMYERDPRPVTELEFSEIAKDSLETLWKQNNVNNYGLHYEIRHKNGKVYLAKVIDDEGWKWLQSPERQFPIVVDPTIVFGANSTSSSGDPEYVDVTLLNSTTFVTVYKDRGNDNYGTAMVGTISGKTISYGSEYVFNSGESDRIVVDALDSSKFVVIYTDRGDNDHGNSIIGTISGSTISYGSEYTFYNGDYAYFTSVESLNSTSFVVAYAAGGSTWQGRAIIGTVSGSTISYGSTSSYNGRSYDNELLKVDSSKFIVAYDDLDNSDVGTVRIGSISGTTITWGNEYTFGSSSFNGDPDMALLDSSTFTIIYSVYDEGHNLAGIVGSISGTTVSFGSETVASTGEAVNSDSTSLDSSTIVATYKDYDSSWKGTLIIGSVSGTTITFSDEVVFYDSFTAETSIDKIDSESFVISYDNLANVESVVGAFNSTPTNTSLTLTNAYFGNQVLSNDSTEYTFRAVVEDADGYEDIDSVELRLATSADNTTPYQALEFTWTQSGDNFEETLDTGSVASITSTGTDSTCSLNSCTLDFKLKFNSSFATKSTNYNAELYTTDSSSDTDEDSYSNIYQVLPVYTIQNATNVNVTLASDWSTSVESTAQYGEVDLGVQTNSDDPVARFAVDFDANHDWSNLSADSDSSSKKAYMHYTSGFSSIPGNADSDYILYVPKGENDAMVGICPGATSLSSVNNSCDDLYILKSADASVSEVEIDGDDYWAISGLTGTGGFSFSAYGDGLELRNVEIARVGETKYLVAATTGGVTVTDESTWVSYDSDYNELVYKAAVSSNGDLYFMTSEKDLRAVYDITDLSADFSSDFTYSGTTTPAITDSGVDLNNIYVQSGASFVDGSSNVIYLATDEGVVVINEKQGDEAKGSVKYFTKDYVTEGMVGDGRGMWGFATDDVGSALSVGDSLSSSDQLDDYSVNDSDLDVVGTPDVVEGVRGTALDFNGTTDYLVQENYDTEQGTIGGTLTAGSAQLTDSGQDFDDWDTEGGTGSAAYLVAVTDNSGDEIWGYLYDESLDDGSSDTSVEIEDTLDGTGSQNWSGDTGTFSFGDTPVVYEIRDTRFQISGDLSFGAWVRYDSKEDYMRIINKYHTSTTYGYILCLDAATDQRFALYVVQSSMAQLGISAKTIPATDGTWYFVVGTYDSSEGEIAIYVNGVLENSRDDVSSSLAIGPDPFAIGVRPYTEIKHMDGAIDEPFVIADTLSADQISHMYEVGRRSLQNHTASNLSGIDTDSNIQQLYGSTNIVTSVFLDEENNQLYIGTNDSSNNGGVSVINLASDSLVDIYSNQSSKIDTAGNYWGSTHNDVVSLNISSKFASESPNNLIIATDEMVWMGDSDISVTNIINESTSSTVVKDLLVANQINMKGDIKPDVAGVYNLGSEDMYWAGAYADTFYSTSATIGSFDIAEDYYAADPTIQAGDVVAFADGDSIAIEKTENSYQRDVIGVVSTQPGITLSYWRGDADEIKNMRPVALAGRVPVKVTDENGPVEKGDFLVPSSKRGYAMNACGPKFCEASLVIGRALESFDSVNSGDSESVAIELINSQEEVNNQLENSVSEHPLEELEALLVEPVGSVGEQITVEDEVVEAVFEVEEVLTEPMELSESEIGEGRIMMFVDLMWHVPSQYNETNELDMTLDDRLGYLDNALNNVELNTSAWNLEGNLLTSNLDIIANSFFADSAIFSVVSTEIVKIGGSNFVVDSLGNVDMAGDLKIAGVVSGRYGDLKVILGDNDGQTALNVENSDDEVVFSVDSEGQIHARELAIIDSTDKTLGRTAIPAGTKAVRVLSSAINSDVKIFVTPRIEEDDVVIPRLVVSEKQDGYFEVSVDSESSVEVNFDWWVVE